MCGDGSECLKGGAGEGDGWISGLWDLVPGSTCTWDLLVLGGAGGVPHLMHATVGSLGRSPAWSLDLFHSMEIMGCLICVPGSLLMCGGGRAASWPEYSRQYRCQLMHLLHTSAHFPSYTHGHLTLTAYSLTVCGIFKVHLHWEKFCLSGFFWGGGFCAVLRSLRIRNAASPWLPICIPS